MEEHPVTIERSVFTAPISPHSIRMHPSMVDRPTINSRLRFFPAIATPFLASGPDHLFTSVQIPTLLASTAQNESPYSSTVVNSLNIGDLSSYLSHHKRNNESRSSATNSKGRKPVKNLKMDGRDTQGRENRESRATRRNMM